MNFSDAVTKILESSNLNEAIFPLRGRVTKIQVNQQSRDSYIEMIVKGEPVIVQFLRTNNKGYETRILSPDGTELKDLQTSNPREALLAWMHAAQLFLRETSKFSYEDGLFWLIFVNRETRTFKTSSILKLVQHLADRMGIKQDWDYEVKALSTGDVLLQDMDW